MERRVLKIRHLLPVLALACAARVSSAAEPAYAADTAGYTRVVQPFLQDHCVKCHGSEKQKGDLRLDTLPNNFLDPATVGKWADVVDTINGHEMPPEKEPQPDGQRAGAFAEWITAELGRAEVAKRSTRVILRRMNRAEYDNTVRDLVGVSFSPAEKFPEDPPAGGFDNIGVALTVSPLHMELYYAAARQVLDRALFEGAQPAALKWRFEPEENTEGGDRYRVKREWPTAAGAKPVVNNILLNDGKNPTENGFTLIHHNSWDKSVGFRDFKLPVEGEYIIRFRAAGRVPKRAEVVAAARTILETRRDDEVAKNPTRKEGAQRQLESDLKHFETHRMYDYGAPRVKLVQDLGGTPRVLVEMDVEAPDSAPKIYEVRANFSKLNAGLSFEYAYSIPSVLENFWMQGKDTFARPVLLIDWIEIEGPIYPSWPPPSHRRVLPEIAGKSAEKDEKEYAREVLSRFMTRAYRRPLAAGELDPKLALFEKARAENVPYLDAIKRPLTAVLTSPHFLYLVEPEAPAAQLRKLNGYELASRLSYFLWSSMPDGELFRLAANGEILKPAVLGQQLTRMLADPKSEAFVKNFAGQWLGLRKVGANPPATNLYPEYDRHLETSIVRETESFFAELLRHDLDARNLIKSNFVTINERLARFYGIPGVKGDEFRRVPAPPESHRGGLVTQASIHSITSNGTRTSPVSRGVWVLKTLLGTDPGLPVANVGDIPPKVPGMDKATVRQRLQIHREQPACARCHDKIDPLGFALENFNACGEWRAQEGHGYQGRIEKNDPVIDGASKMPDGTEFTGVEGLQTALLKKEDLFLNALSSQLYTYALGRELGFSDRPAVRASVEAMKRNRYLLRALLITIVQSDLFTTK